MRILLAVFSCHRYEYPPDDWFKRPVVDRVSALRDTWLKDVTIDYKFSMADQQSHRGASKDRSPTG